MGPIERGGDPCGAVRLLHGVRFSAVAGEEDAQREERSEHRLVKMTETVFTPAQQGFFSISPFEAVMSGLTIALLMWMNDALVAKHEPLLIPSFAASIAVIYTQPGMSNARSWNVIAGQFLGGVAGFVSISIFHSSTPLAAGFAIFLGLVIMRLSNAIHPPGVATALIVVLSPVAHGVRFLFFPVLAGAIIVVLIAWLTHLVQLAILHTLQRSINEPLFEP